MGLYSVPHIWELRARDKDREWSDRVYPTQTFEMAEGRQIDTTGLSGCPGAEGAGPAGAGYIPPRCVGGRVMEAREERLHRGGRD